MSPALDFRPPARFRILRRVGAGGMGAVYEAIDENNGSRVALKTLTAVAPDRVLAFKDEFRSLAGFSHPNVATLYELLTADDHWFISMEFIEGARFLDYLYAREPGEATTSVGGAWRTADEETLTLAMVDESAITHASMENVRRANFTASPLKLRDTMRQLAEALIALHTAGILHRDLKPSNVMITSDGHLFVLDFGLAERLNQFGESSRPEHVSGTVTYMAPEQAAGEVLSAAADWYAFGVMLYEALSGCCPFTGPVSRIVWDKQKLDPPPLSAEIIARDPELASLCMELVQREPARRPQGAEMIARLGGTAATMPATPRRAAFVGRESQLATLRAAFDHPDRGVTKVALIFGKSGMRKSALVAHFLAELEGRTDVLVLAGRCYEKETLPFKAFDSIVDSLARYLTERSTAEVNRVIPRGVSALSQVFPVLNQVTAIGAVTERNPVRDARELRLRAFGALRDLLIRMGDLRRLVVYIDDVQWGDADSAALLRHIAQRPDAPEMLLLAACREEYAEQGELLSALRAQPDCLRIDVGPLTVDETCRLAADLYGADRKRAERIARESGGSPYFVQELREDSDSAGGPAASLDAVLCRRVVALPSGARQLVEVVAVSGRPLPEVDACMAAGLTGEDQRTLAMLRAERLIRGASGQIETYHDRVREAVVLQLDAGTLKRHHLALATTLEASAADAEAIAGHLADAGEPARAAPHYVRAAERASDALAFDRAAKLLSRAAELSPETGDGRRQLLVKLADALANAGRGVEAARSYREAKKGASPDDVVELERREAYWFAASGHVDEGREALEGMLKRVGVRIPGLRMVIPALVFAELRLLLSPIRVRELPRERIHQRDLDRLDACWYGVRAFGMIDPTFGVYVLASNILLALRVGESDRIARMLIFYAVGCAAIGSPFGARRIPRYFAIAADLVRKSGNAYVLGFLAYGLGMVALAEGRWIEALSHFDQAEEIFTQQCTGVAWELASTRIFSLWALFYRGQYRELRERAARFGDEGRERGDLYVATSIGTFSRAAAELIAGFPDQARLVLEESLSVWTRQKYSVQFATSVWVRAWIHLYENEGAMALDFLNREWAGIQKHHYLRLNGTRQWLRYARAQSALAVGQHRLAGNLAKELDADRVPFAQVMAKTVRAGCASVRGDRQVAVQLLGEAAREFDEVDMPMMAAVVRRRLGILIGDTSLVEAADGAMRAEGVAQPERLTHVFVNGF